MNTEKMNRSARKLSDIVLEELKAIAAGENKLTSGVLASRLSSRSEFAALMDAAPDNKQDNKQDKKPDQKPDKKPDAPSVSEIETLKNQLEKSREQREKLLKQLTGLEEAAARSEGIYRRGLLMIAELVGTDTHPSVSNVLAGLKSGLKQGADIFDLEAGINQIKNIAIQDEPARNPERAGFFGKFRKRTPAESAEHEGLDGVKEAYAAIVGELKLNLDQNSFNRLAKVEAQIDMARQVDEFLSIRKEMISLIQDYISRVSGEREEAAAFIREISKRLIEVETHILDTFPQAQETHQANEAFNTLLEQKIGELRESVNFSKTLAELKQTVVSSLSSIQKALEEKREKDEARISEVDRRMKRLQQDMERMKTEVASERDRADLLEQEALIDPLTGVYNRRAYERRIKEELRRYLRHQRPFSLLLLDVDHFKSINDQYGHAVGDLCLKEIINRVRPRLRESDFLARFGGEEFILLLPETSQSGAVEAAEKLRTSIEKTEFLHRGNPVAITISIGVTQVMSTDQQSDTLFGRVDRAMYRAKAAGRNCVVEA